MAYGYASSIEIKHTAVASDESNFPVALILSDNRFRTVANGGRIENTDANGGASGSLEVPADFVPGPNQDGSSPYDYECIDYDPTTGDIEMWSEITSISSSTNTPVYLTYSDNAVTTSQEDVNGTWKSNYRGVWHMSGGGTGTVYDSTSYDNDGSDNASATGTAGQIGEGRELDGNDYYSMGEGGGDLDPGSTCSFMVWFKGTDGHGGFISKTGGGGGGMARGYWVHIGNVVGEGSPPAGAPGARWRSVASACDGNYVDDGTFHDDDWHMFVAVKSGSYTGNVDLYIDGGVRSHSAYRNQGCGSVNSNYNFYLGGQANLNRWYYNGHLDEVMVYDDDVDSDHVTTSYNNQSDPEEDGTFWSALGSEVEAGSYVLTADVAYIQVAGQDATLTTDGAIGYQLVAEHGEIHVAGQDATLTADIAISLTWTDNSEHEDGFTIERQTDGGAWVEVVSGLAADTESYEENMEVGHTYNYRVKAESAVLGDSEWSNEDDVAV